MTRYTVIPAAHGPGYRIEVFGSNGGRHTILGFDTEHETAVWIEADKRREHGQIGASLSEPC